LATLGLTAAALTGASPVAAEPHRYELDPAHTTVAFLIDHVGYAATLGIFRGVEGSFVYDMEAQTLSNVEIWVVTDTVDTFHDARDQHVRSGDFLDVDVHDAMTFTADGGDPSSDTTGTVTGDLTLLGETRPLTLEVTLNKADAYPFGHGRFTLGLSARGAILRSDYGMTYGIDGGLVGDRVQIIVETEAMRVD
jgi:polyisoprenoid-binding protein YceI